MGKEFVPGTTDHASVLGREAAHGTEVPLRLGGRRRLRREVVGRIGVCGRILHESKKSIYVRLKLVNIKIDS